MEQMRAQAERFGTEFVTADVTRVEFSRPADAAPRVRRRRGHHARAVIVATGATARQLGLPGERALQGRGVTLLRRLRRARSSAASAWWSSAAATPRWRRRRSWPSSPPRCTIVHRRDEFRASQDHAGPRARNPKIAGARHVVEDVLGDKDGKVSGVRLRNVEHRRGARSRRPTASSSRSATTRTPAFRGLARAWTTPATSCRRAGSTRDERRWRVRGRRRAVDHVYRQAITAAGSGCMAALDAERWLTRRARRRSGSRGG